MKAPDFSRLREELRKRNFLIPSDPNQPVRALEKLRPPGLRALCLVNIGESMYVQFVSHRVYGQIFGLVRPIFKSAETSLSEL